MRGPAGSTGKPGATRPALTGREPETSAACKDRACSPAVEGVVSRDDVGAVFAGQELDAVVEGLHGGRVRLALLDDVQGVPGPPAEQAVLTGRLQAAVRVQAIHQAIWRGRGRAGVSGLDGAKPLRDANTSVPSTRYLSRRPDSAGSTHSQRKP